MVASISASLRLGEFCGRRERSARPSTPSAANRASHLYPVFLLMPNAVQSVEKLVSGAVAKRTNSSREDIREHSIQGIARSLTVEKYDDDKSVTYVSLHLLPMSPG